MDQSRKRAREGDGGEVTMRRQQQQQQADVAAEVADALLNGRGAFREEEPWQRPPGVFELPWQKCRGGLGLVSSGSGWEHLDVFFRSLVDGGTAAIGVPGDRLFTPPSKLTMFDDVEAWLAAAGEGEVDPLWRSAPAGPRARPPA